MAEQKKFVESITPRDQDFTQWYTDVCIKADLTGYTEYYLTEKFKKETGYTITNYAKFVKVERAKMLLETTNDSMQEIADALAFSSRNYFTKVFTEVAGMSPTEYRKKRTGGGN